MCCVWWLNLIVIMFNYESVTGLESFWFTHPRLIYVNYDHFKLLLCLKFRRTSYAICYSVYFIFDQSETCLRKSSTSGNDKIELKKLGNILGVTLSAALCMKFGMHLYVSLGWLEACESLFQNSQSHLCYVGFRGIFLSRQQLSGYSFGPGCIKCGNQAYFLHGWLHEQGGFKFS